MRCPWMTFRSRRTLRAQLASWNARAGTTLAGHGFDWPDEVSRIRHEAEGADLAQRLQEEWGVIVQIPSG